MESLILGLGLVLVGGCLQGSFVLPMTLTRRWQWEHGWAMFISLAILVSNLGGLWRGEWRNAGPPSRARLNLGLAVLLLAVVVCGVASAL